MHVIGIICEYNPMHLGHLYQIKKIKEMYDDSIIIIVTNSCFTQRGDISIINKWDKCSISLDYNVNIVIELPFVYSTQSADIFASGAIKILNYLGVDTIVFGSESNDILKLENIVATQLHDANYSILVKEYMDMGISYPTALSKSLVDILGYTVSSPNDLLAISYIKEIKKNNYNINYVSIKRTNEYNDMNISNDNIVSASLIRKMIREKKNVNNYIVNDSFKYIYNDVAIDKVFNYLKYKIISDDISIIQTVDEGIDNRIKKEILFCDNYEDLVFRIKSKRYTYNKINRMMLHILTSFTKEEANDLKIDYIRLIGFDARGRKYLNNVKKNISIPIITNYKKNISKILDIEFRTTCIYSMIVNDNNIIDNEFRHKPIIKDN